VQTKHGYTKIRAPEHVFKLIKEFWELNKGKEKIEMWDGGYVNKSYYHSIFFGGTDNRHIPGVSHNKFQFIGMS
jgi:hypothetical protein